MQIKLGSLVLTIQKDVKSAGIEFDNLKQLLILSYPLEKEIQEAKSFTHVLLQFINIVHQLTLLIILSSQIHYPTFKHIILKNKTTMRNF